MNQILDDAGVRPLQEPMKGYPVPGTRLARILNDTQFRQSFHAQLKRYNPMIAALYRVGLLPLFGMSRTVMLLTTRGWKSGKLRSTPIGYFRIGGVVHLFSAWGKGASWYKNLIMHPDEVWIQIGMRKKHVSAYVLKDPAEIYCMLEEFVSESPETTRDLFGWESGRDRMETADFSAVIDRVIIIRFVERQDP